MEKISKNIEMTGERSRDYDQWRSELKLDFVIIPFLDYSRIRGRASSAWPIFNLTASIYPAQTDSDAKPNEDDLRRAFKLHQEDLIKFNLLAKQIVTFPSYLGLMNRQRDWFLAQQFPRKDPQTDAQRPPQLYSATDFVEIILKQTWEPDYPELSDNPKDNPFKSYSAWHRKAMPSNALVMDIDYVEIRSNKPVAVIEATKSNTDDLCYGLFSFLSRGFAQASVILLVAEDLGVNAYLVTYPQSMSEVELLKMDRSLIHTIDALDRSRQQIAKKEMDAGNSRKIAQGKATKLLYQTEGTALMLSLMPQRKRLSITDYAQWLASL